MIMSISLDFKYIFNTLFCEPLSLNLRLVRTEFTTDDDDCPLPRVSRIPKCMADFFIR